jgi:hypothetical protein
VQNNVPQTVLNELKRNGIKPNLSFVSFNRFLSVDNDVVPPPLYLAIRMRNVEMVKWLLENGTNVHFQYGILTMWQALWQDEYEALTSGQVIDNSESTKKRDEIAKMLLASKINPNAKLFDSYSVFAIAVRSSASEELINHQNKFVAFKGMTVEASKDAEGNDVAFLYNWDGSGEDGNDLYFNVSLDGQTYTFTVESYLCDNTTDVYAAVKNLQIGDVVDMEGFLYWYEGVNPHITSLTVVE